MAEDKVFEEEKAHAISRMAAEPEMQELTQDWFLASCRHRYSYAFHWLGLPIIQYPQDIVATQEIIWKVKPDLIIETGVARGGSVIFYASMLALLGDERKVIGIDVDIRSPNRKAIETHAMAKHIHLIEGSSTSKEVLDEVRRHILPEARVMVVLDSNHTHDHVLQELRLYAPLVSVGSYLLVFDTVIENMPKEFFPDRPWGPGDNPYTAVHEFLQESDDFVVDPVHEKLQITVAPDGYLKRVKG